MSRNRLLEIEHVEIHASTYPDAIGFLSASLIYASHFLSSERPAESKNADMHINIYCFEKRLIRLFLHENLPTYIYTISFF